MNFGGFRWIRWTSGVPLNLPLNLSFLVYIKYSVFHSSDVCRWLPVVLQNIIKPHMTQTHSKPTLTWQSAGLQEWETDWLMEFNPFKCEAITFTRPISAVSVSFERRTTVRPVFIICTVFIRSYCSLSAARLIQYTSAYSLVVRYCSESSRHRKWRWLCNRSANPRILKLLRPLFVDIWRNAISVATAGFFPLDLGFFGVVWVSGYFCQ